MLWRARSLFLAATACVAACTHPSKGGSAGLSATDREAIHHLDSTFVRAWLDDDTTRVLAVFDSAAILLPPNTSPVSGLDAIKSYWWPSDGSHTQITAFTRSMEELQGEGSLAYSRGRSTLAWTYAKGGAPPQSQTSRSVDLFVYGRDADGTWRVRRQMWTAVP